MRWMVLLSLTACGGQLHCESSCDTTGVVVTCYTDTEFTAMQLTALEQPAGLPVHGSAQFVGFITGDDVPACLTDSLSGGVVGSLDQQWRGKLNAAQLGDFNCAVAPEVFVDPTPGGGYNFSSCGDVSLGQPE